MLISDIKIGEYYTYYPAKNKAGDTTRFLVKVEDLKKRVKIRVFTHENQGGSSLFVGANRLEDRQAEVFGVFPEVF